MQNSSGRMSDFFRNLNTHYASGYRKSTGGKGYVFQSRFRSTIIEDDSYLKMAIIYVLQNPLRAGLVDHYDDYCWSSGSQYVQKKKLAWLDADYVLELFGGRKGLADAMRSDQRESLPLLHTQFGPVLGEDAFLSRALAEFDRRHQPDAVKKRRGMIMILIRWKRRSGNLPGPSGSKSMKSIRTGSMAKDCGGNCW